MSKNLDQAAEEAKDAVAKFRPQWAELPEDKALLAEKVTVLTECAGGRKAAAKAMSVAETTLDNYRSGKSQPKFLELLNLAQATSLGVGFLAEGIASSSELSSQDANGSFLKLPFFAAEAAAGFGRIALEELPAGSVAFERAFLRSLGASPDNCFVMKSRGDSMQPTIPDDSILVVDQSQTEKIEHGCLYVFRVADVLLVKRARWHMDGKLELSSDNTAYQPEFLDQTHADTLSVLGRVVYFCRVP
jgi:SOS-response transcriptional repressor LexA